VAAVNDDYDRIAQETAAAMEWVAEAAANLAQQEITWKSADGRITVRATSGTITGLDLAPSMPQRYDSETLGKLLADALRAAQLKARKEFTEAFEERIPSRVRETERLIRESVRE
jgi:DNA-binding protein YbaB